MREIKFRGWNKQSHTMVDNIRLFSPGDTFSLNDAFDPDMIVLPLQYIGQVDVNDKEIYEGDIVARVNAPRPEPKVVEYNAKSGVYNGIRRSYGLEVIGNIYENPELIK